MNIRPTLRIIAGQAVYVFADGTVLPRVAGGDGPTAEATLPAEIAERLGRLAELEDDELADLEADLQAHLDGIIDPVEAGEVEATDEVIASAAAARDAINTVRADAERRYTEAAEADAEAERRRAELAAIRDEVAPDEEEGEEGETEGGEGDESAPAETPPAPGDAPAGEAQETPPAPEGDAPAAIAANAAPYPRPGYRPPLERVAARRRRSERGRPATTGDQRPRVTLTAAADLRSMGAGSVIDSELRLAEAIIDRAEALRFVAPGANGMKYPVAQARAAYAEERQLSRDNAIANAERLDAAMGPSTPNAARTASGGICAPAMPDYTVLNITDDSRPIRASLPNFEAPRGAVITMAPPRFHRGLSAAELSEDSAAHDFSTGVGQWTAANDVALNNPSTKPVVKVDCEETTTTTVYAVTSRLEIGNFYNMTYPERVQAIVAILRAEHASLGERLLLDAVSTGSKHVTGGTSSGSLGAGADILAELDRAVAAYEWRWRMAENHPPLQLWLPDWVHDMIRADRVRTLTAGTTDERWAYTDAQIDAFFDARNVNVTWFFDGETSAGQDFGAQADNAALVGWPSHVISYLHHQGAWAFIDGGTIDLGIIRDSVLADTNDLQMFMESFEAALNRGWESLRIDMDVCPSGISQGTANVDFCATGS